MEPLFSCRNCIHNCGQTLSLGQGAGFCLRHDSVIKDPATTTCKYLHRKDLPYFTVDEGLREHAADFAFFPALVSLTTGKPIERVAYSERYAWEHRKFAPLTHALAQYHKAKPRWIIIQSFTGGTDGLRSVAHTSLVRHYLSNCEHWWSSYRLVLAVLQEIAVEPHFADEDVVPGPGEALGEAQTEALWDVVFARLATLQEYGWHAGIEDLTWITDSLNGSLSTFEWAKVKTDLGEVRATWTPRLIQHAKNQHVYFADDHDETGEEP